VGDAPKDESVLYIGLPEPLGEGAHRAGQLTQGSYLGLGAEQKFHVPPLPLLIRLRFWKVDGQAAAVPVQILAAHRGQLGTAQASGKTNEQDGAVAAGGQS